MSARLTRPFAAIALLAFSAASFGCRSSDDSPKAEEKKAKMAKKPAAEKKPEARPPAPLELLSLDESAFGPSLTFQGESIYLLTTSAAYRVSPGEKPLRLELPLGAHRVLLGDRFVYWKEGMFYEVPTGGGPSKVLAKAPLEPRAIHASTQGVLWLVQEKNGEQVLLSLTGGKPRELYRSKAPLSALTSIDSWAFFVERSDEKTWRIGAVSLDGGPLKWSLVHEGRAPAMLASDRQLYFYDGPVRGVRSLSPDLAVEEPVAENVICSPLVASTHVFCAHIGGLFEVLPNSPTPRILVAQPLGHVAALAASPTHVAWLNDAGENKLVLRVQERMKP